jgi:hypothetical protein
VASDISILARGLIGRMEICEFNQEVRERRAAKFKAALGLEELGQLYDLSKLESFLASDAAPAHSIDIFQAGHLMRLPDVQKKSGKSCLEIVVDHLRKGSTIRVRDLQQSDNQMRRFVNDVQQYFAAQSQVNLYLTPPGTAGFPPHFDITDVFIVQCVGRKEWRIYNDYSNRIELPLMETNWDPDHFKPSPPAEAISLCPGDVLYLPRGVMHEAFCQNDESMHLTVSIVPLTFADLIGKALTSTAKSDIEFRRRVPWPLENQDHQFEELTLQLRELALKLVHQIDSYQLMEDESHFIRTGSGESPSGGLASAIASLRESSGADC